MKRMVVKPHQGILDLALYGRGLDGEIFPVARKRRHRYVIAGNCFRHSIKSSTTQYPPSHLPTNLPSHPGTLRHSLNDGVPLLCLRRHDVVGFRVPLSSDLPMQKILNLQYQCHRRRLLYICKTRTRARADIESDSLYPEILTAFIPTELAHARTARMRELGRVFKIN
ncbi:hypothetical protein BD410DRAFT_100931 [Rickenella mellea]|uniref:Uncharacterized protein n=1 Tax=Rickenella mellea TaxID=50990 RepID=A0A4Y7PLF3_9AGAM|nr:hypothetical protein BD410DRAFT_100931 [Rickenella mellea]